MEFPVQRGRILLISHHILHSASQQEEDPAVVIAIRFSVSDDQFKPFYICHDCRNFDVFFSILRLIVQYNQRYNTIDCQNMNDLLQAVLNLLSAEVQFYAACEHGDPIMGDMAQFIAEKIHCQKTVTLPDLLNQAEEVAYAVGYSDPYIFSNQFKKLAALSLREYRKGLLSAVHIM